MPKKLTNEEIDRRLTGRDVKRIGDYASSKIPILFQCLVVGCHNEWKSSTHHVIGHGSGCPVCAGNIKLTNEEIDRRLIGRNVKRVSDYPGKNDIPMFWQCLECDSQWKTSSNSVINHKTGCPKCAGHIKLTNEDIDQKLISRNIKRIDNYSGRCNVPMLFRCLVPGCDHEWKASTNSIINGGVGCPKCAGNVRLTNEDIDQKLISRNIRRLENYSGNCMASMLFQCLVPNCNHEWKASTSSVLNNEAGCPKCKSSKNEKLVGAILEENGIVVERQKYLKDIFMDVDRRFHIDFYLPQYNTIIEYNGEQHYSPVCFGSMSIEQSMIRFDLQKERDATVQRLCDNNNVQLVWIDGRKYTNSKLKKYMIDELIPRLKSSKTR